MTKVALENVLPFSKNEYGHHCINISGFPLPAATEIYNLENQGHKIDDAARALMFSDGPTSYDRRHRLEAGKIYQVVLVFSREVASFVRDMHPDWDELKLREMTNAAFLKYGERFGYARSLAGLQMRLHELIKPEHLMAMDLHYVASLHEPITGLDGHPWMLRSRLYRSEDTSLTLTLKSGNPQEESHDAGILAYRMP